MNKFLVLLVILITQTVYAADFKVLKVKGNKAVIKVPSDVELSKGQILSTSTGEGDEDSSETSSVSRKYRVGGSFDFNNFTKTTSSSASSSASAKLMGLSILWGWNKKWAEYGPLFSYANEEAGSSKTTDMFIGGYFEYNLKPLQPTSKTVSSIGAQLGINQSKVDNDTATAQGSGTTMQIYYAYKMFNWNNSIAVIPSVGYKSETTDFKEYKYTTSGIYISAGLSTYFW